jgi:hypothetical protein
MIYGLKQKQAANQNEDSPSDLLTHGLLPFRRAGRAEKQARRVSQLNLV